MIGCSPGSGQRITTAVLREVLGEVSQAYGIGEEDLVGESRRKAIAHARQEAMWRLRHRLALDGRPRHSLLEIGRVFNRDHTTVLHGLRAHEARLAEAQEAA